MTVLREVVPFAGTSATEEVALRERAVLTEVIALTGLASTEVVVITAEVATGTLALAEKEGSERINMEEIGV